MKPFLLLLCTFFSLIGFGQGKKDLTKALESAERKAVLETLKKTLQPNLGLVPKLVVKRLVTKAGFAYFAGHVKDQNGSDIDFSKTAYKEALKEGVFDGDATNALLKKSGSRWMTLTFVVGPTDVAWACWWKKYKAPKEIFDYAETCE